MRIAAFLILIAAVACSAQQPEFSINSNGLIYDEATMNRLGHIVDSLNLKFKSCDLTRPYMALAQGRGTFVEIKKKSQLRLIRSGVTLEEYKKKFPRSVIHKNLWITKSQYVYDSILITEYGGLGARLSNTVRIKGAPPLNATGWVVDDYEQEAYYIHSLEARELPLSYARLVQYVDCMIDTSTDVFLPGAKREYYKGEADTTKIGKFLAWADSYPGRPRVPEYTEKNVDSLFAIYEATYPEWDSLRLLYMDEQMKRSAYAQQLLADAREEAFQKTESVEELERYASRYLPPADVLRLKRSRIVHGFCSQDDRPRVHAVEICMLAARTAQWDVFLRSHLDVMNDKFARSSDGSYAWAARETYLKELEALDIETIDLLLGTVLQVSNAGENHYVGSYSRIGRALTDVEEKDALEQRLQNMIGDEQLDLNNRMELFWVYWAYTRHLKDEVRRASCLKKLEQLEVQLPEDLRHALKMARG